MTPLRRKVLREATYTLCCVAILSVSCFDCLVSLVTAEALRCTEENPIWSLFLESGTVRSLVALKFFGILGAAFLLYFIHRDFGLRFLVVLPVLGLQTWLFMYLNWGSGDSLFSFDFSEPFELINLTVEMILRSVS